MLLHEVCQKCGLTKKAIEYYEKQQLIQPRLFENGYRDFSESDVERLQKIAVLRRLGFSVPDIQDVLDGRVSLYDMSTRKALEAEALKTKQTLAQELAKNQDWEEIRTRLDALEKKQSIIERLVNGFPGYYGKYVSMHFAFYLQEPISTAEQQEAFESIIAFLDRVDFKIPADLQDYFDEATKDFDESFMRKLSEGMNRAIQAPEAYIAENQEALAGYWAFRQSDEYRQSQAYKLREFLETFNSTSGYYDTFIPAMKRLSPAYRQYHEAMEKANQVFAKKYPSETVP